MLDIIIEIVTDLFQPLMFCGFLYLFMEKPDNRKRNVICFLLFSTVMFGILLYSSLVEYYMIINDLMFLAVLEIYSLLCLRGNIFSRIFMPLIAFLINTVISFAFSYFVSFFTGYTHYELVTEPTIYRYICIVVINLTDVLVFSMLVKFRNHKVNLRKITDVIAFIILPVIVLLIVYCTFYIMVITKYEANIMVYLSVICLCMITVTAIVWYAVSRISRENEASTKLLLMEQKIDLYEHNILQSNVQIEKISRIKHDMKNNLLCIDNLISNTQLDEAHKICQNLTDKYSSIGSVVNTENYLLNAVLNVEIEKARCNEISVKLSIANDMKMFSNGSDMISIIGNIFDNAISYLSENKIENKEMAGYFGMSVSDFIEQYNDMSIEEYAKDSLKRQCVQDLLVEAKNVTVTDEELNKEIQYYIDELGYKDKKDVLDTMPEEEIRSELLYTNLMTALLKDTKIQKAE